MCSLCQNLMLYCRKTSKNTIRKGIRKVKKKTLVTLVIAVIVVIACITGYSLIHSDTEAVETMAENSTTVAEAETPAPEENNTPEPLPEEKTNTGAETAQEEQEAETETKPEESQPTDSESTKEPEQEAENEPEKEENSEAETEMPKPETPEVKSVDALDTYMYTTADVNMREGYTTDTNVVKVVPYGTKVHVTGIVSGENWYRVDAESEGYISGKYLSSEEPVAQVQEQAQAQPGSSFKDSDYYKNLSPEAKELYDTKPSDIKALIDNSPDSWAGWAKILEDNAHMQPSGPGRGLYEGNSGGRHLDGSRD